MQEKADQNNSKYGHFLRSVLFSFSYILPYFAAMVCYTRTEFYYSISESASVQNKSQPVRSIPMLHYNDSINYKGILQFT